MSKSWLHGQNRAYKFWLFGAEGKKLLTFFQKYVIIRHKLMKGIRARAFQVLKTISAVKNRRVISLPIYITNRCTSGCKTCNIWKNKEKIDLEVKIIKELINDDEIGKDVEFVLTGGDFLLHPECGEIVSLFKGRNLRVFSNGIFADELISLLKKEDIKFLSVSLDGKPETNTYIRGVDTYENVEKIVRKLKDITRIEIEYTISEWNTREDLAFVRYIAKKHKVGLSVGYYSNVEYFRTEEKRPHLYSVSDILNSEYHSLYPLWAEGKVSLPCFSIFIRPVIKPNGDVELCEAREVKFGNLYEKSFGDIWRDKNTENTIRSNLGCNGCWLNCQRMVDLGVTYIPRRLGFFHKHW